MRQRVRLRLTVAFVLVPLIGGQIICGEEKPAAGPEPVRFGAGKLFVDVSAADYIEVIDLGTRKTVDKIKVGLHPHGLALGRRSVDSREREFLYVTVESTGELVIHDATTHEFVGKVEVGKRPNQLTVTPGGAVVYVPVRDEAQVAVVALGRDGRAPTVLKRQAIGEWPHNAYTGQTTGRI